ncbi:hypothetical protein SEMRO_1085_G239540.1 [Seminavis robusta]|uniref:Uncharacterized protein n=1 Tax=Seminavis robusta TaxID=568900 RepID=A0A9N8EGC7_9STRA|nr:hypothetical protein SEMRO_1085_G239540.1 [Seminavis robusta]|eukprot:Sro1085_g239540.1 n/a (128) ;mRNA; r:3183-3566
MVPPMLVQDEHDQDIGYAAPSSDWVGASLNKLAALKTLLVWCNAQNIKAPRYTLDCSIDTLMGGGDGYDKPFIILLTATILDQMREGDEALVRILLALKTAKVLSIPQWQRAQGPSSARLFNLMTQL